MKKFLKVTNTLGKKNTILAVVALVLIMTTVVGASFSWIEEVSHVEFSSSDGQQTPLHVGDKKLNSDAVIKSSSKTSSISLNDYFYKSGGMHLSPCYGDGDNFYFPVEKITSGGTTSYRTGTKDDANVNYLSATFRVRSEDAGCVFWFEKTGSTDYITFEKGSSESVSGLDQYLRMSVTVDGAKNVYALNNTGKFHTVSGSPAAPVEETGRRIDQYTYYDEEFTNNLPNTSANSAKANQGASGDNLNGNTVFSVPKYDDTNSSTKTSTTKTVTVKLWLEYGAGAKRVDISKININLVSSWAKTRRIYIKDETIDEIDNGRATGEHWLTTQNTPTLHWALKSDTSKHWEKTGNASTYVQYFADIPAVYNNFEVNMYRCNNGWNKGNTHTGESIKYWDKYPTTFPDTFHSETYTVYTKSFGTWESETRHVEVINSCHFTYNSVTQFSQPYAYMWSSATDTGVSEKVVQNGTWPGVTMTKLNKKKSNLDVFAFYYDSTFDRIIFNDNFSPAASAYQTEDINLDPAKTNPQYYNGKCYDIATLKWYNSFNDLPTYSGYSLRGEFFTSDNNNRWTITRMVQNSTNANEVYCRVYVRYKNDDNQYYRFQIMKNDSSEWWGYGHDNTSTQYWYIDGQMSNGNKPTLENGNGSNNLRLHATNTNYYKHDYEGTQYDTEHPGIYGFYFNTSDHTLWVQKEQPDGTHITN